MILLDLNDWLALLGRTHPLIVHLPIGIVLMALVLESLSVFNRFKSLKPATDILWIAGALSACIASVAGWLLAQEEAYPDDLLLVHQWLGISVAVLATLTAVAKFYFSSRIAIQRLLYFVVAVVLAAAGHYGGSLTHGEDFLTEPLAAIFGFEEQDTTVVVKPKVEITDIEKAIVYQDLVAPVLEQKCVKCHNLKKSKGKLRLDHYDFIVKGGKSGHTLVEGNPSESELYKRLILPAGDKKRMPPKGKTQLTKEEIELIHWWIGEGSGSRTRRVEELLKPEKINHVLASFSSEQALEFVREIEIPEISVAEPSAQAIRDLESAGVIVSRLSPDSPFLAVNCVNAPSFGDEQAKLLLPLKENIVWLRAGDTKLSDEGMKSIAALKNLTRLSLENTLVTDEGIAGISALASLWHLNVVNTKVSDKSIPAISKIAKIKAVYLWKTQFTNAGVAELRKRRPLAEINFGDTENPAR